MSWKEEAVKAGFRCSVAAVAAFVLTVALSACAAEESSGPELKDRARLAASLDRFVAGARSLPERMCGALVLEELSSLAGSPERLMEHVERIDGGGTPFDPSRLHSVPWSFIESLAADVEGGDSTGARLAAACRGMFRDGAEGFRPRGEDAAQVLERLSSSGESSARWKGMIAAVCALSLFLDACSPARCLGLVYSGRIAVGEGWEAQLARAWAARFLGDASGAREFLEKARRAAAAEGDSSNPRLSYLEALLLHDDGKDAAALELLRPLVEKGDVPSPAPFRLYSSLCASAGDYSKGAEGAFIADYLESRLDEEQLRRVAKWYDPGMEWLARAAAGRLLERVEEAVAASANPLSLLLGARVDVIRGRWSEAFASYRKVLAFFPMDVDLRMEAGMCGLLSSDSGMQREAVRALAGASLLALVPPHDVRYMRCRKTAGRALEAAAAIIASMMRRDPAALFHCNLALCRYSEAAAALEAASGKPAAGAGELAVPLCEAASRLQRGLPLPGTLLERIRSALGTGTEAPLDRFAALTEAVGCWFVVRYGGGAPDSAGRRSPAPAGEGALLRMTSLGLADVEGAWRALHGGDAALLKAALPAVTRCVPALLAHPRLAPACRPCSSVPAQAPVSATPMLTAPVQPTGR